MSSAGNLLLVEDNEDDVFAFQYALKKAGLINLELNVVTDGRQAIDYLSGSGQFSDRMRFPVPALVFLDLKLPFFNGHEILKWIREESDFRSLPVVILSGSDESRDHELAVANGATEYLVKPASSADLLQELKAQGIPFELQNVE